MKEYAYFPGCSLEKLAISYHTSAQEAARKLDVSLTELEDWNCCGSTTYFHIDELLAYALTARNLAIAERTGLDVVAPCSACFKNMYFTSAHMKKDPDLAEHINYALEEDGLTYSGKTRIRHLLEMFAQDVGVEAIKQRVGRRFFGQAAIGATPIEYPLKVRCCGGSLIISSRVAALSMVRNLLQSAVDRDAAVIATACPMCQVNLECYQRSVNQEFGTNYSVPILYFTQLLGLALGSPKKRLGIGKELVSAVPVLAGR